MILTSGGLGPTADDLTAEVVADFTGRELRLDEALEGRIAAILERLRARWRGGIDEDALRAGNRKQAMVPDGATVLEPVGTAPGLVVPADGATFVVLPGPPGELQPMWHAALETEALQAALAGAGVYEQRILRLFGPPESEIAKTLREAERDGVPLERLEITTCLRRGEIEIATVFEPYGRRRLRRVRGGGARAPRRDGVRARRRDDRRAGRRRPARAAGPHGRGRGVLHRRADGGAADRPGRLLGLRARRPHGLLRRGQVCAGGCATRA